MEKKSNSFYMNEPDCIKPDEYDCNVIIIGSGITGLTAAYNIIEKNCGITVLVLEGSDKIGGRLAMSGATKGFFIDIRQTYINKLINKLGLETVYRSQIENEHKIYYSKNGLIIQQKNMFNKVKDFIKGLDLTAASIDFKIYTDYPEAKKLAKMSLDALIKSFIICSKGQEFMKAIAYSICGVEASSVSALWFIVMAIGSGGLKKRIKFALGNNQRQFIQDGADKILKELLQRVIYTDEIKIQTNSFVNLIEFNDVYTYVSLSNGEQYKCEYAIVAVPPPESTKIKISPPKEEVLKNQMSYEPGKGIFFVAKYEEAWWFRNNYSGDILGSSDNPDGVKLVYEVKDNRSKLSPFYLLAGFLKNDKKSEINLFNALKKCWSKKITRISDNFETLSYLNECKSYKEWKWQGENDNANGLNEGGYPMSVMKPSNIKNHINPMLKPHQRVYWACSEYARSWPGTLDGAVESGEYVAYSILYQVRPQSLNSEELRFITTNTVDEKNDLPLNLVALHFFITGIVTGILIIYCKPSTGYSI